MSDCIVTGNRNYFISLQLCKVFMYLLSYDEYHHHEKEKCIQLDLSFDWPRLFIELGLGSEGFRFQHSLVIEFHYSNQTGQ